MGKTCQPLECLDAVYGSTRSGCGGLEPGLDRALGAGMTVPAILGIWLNPRIFRKPVSTDNWASKAVLGERVWINRKQIPVSKHHCLVPNLLSGMSGLGLWFLIWGLWRL